MLLDLNAFPAPVRAQQIQIGQQFGSKDTLDQANQTLKAYAVGGEALAGFGFTVADAERLAAARALLIDAGVGRETARGQKKVTSRTYTEALTAAQAARLSARVILAGAEADLEESATSGDEEAARIVGTVLRQTRVAGDRAESLAQQLDQIASALQHKAVEGIAKPRGGAEAVARLTATAAALRKADQDDAGIRGTHAETQRLHQIDGIIVRLVRRARKAALAVARATANPALAEEFRLEKLYQSRGSSYADSADSEAQGAERVFGR